MTVELVTTLPEGQALAREGSGLDGWLPARILEEHDAFLTLDPDWRLTYLNKRAEHLLQRPRSELLGQIVWQAWPHITGGTFEHQFRRAARERERVSFEEFHAQRGQWLEVVADPWDQGLAVSLRDITERKRRERRDLYFRVAAAAISSASGMPEAMAAFARSVAVLTGWSYAETWAPSSPGGPLRCLDVVRFERPGHAEFERASRAMTIAPGVGLVGQAISRRAPLLVSDLPSFDSPRTPLGTAAGFACGLAIPLFAQTEAIGVITFFTERAVPDDWFRVLEEHRQIDLLFERHHAQEALRRSEERHRLLFEDGPAPMAIYEAQSLRILSVNQRAIELYGFTREEFLAMSMGSLDAPGEGSHAPVAVLHEPAGAEWRAGLWQHRKKDGTLLPVNISSHQLLLDGRPVRVAVLTDMSEQQRSLAKLHEQATLLDSANDAIVVRSLDGAITYWNQGAERLYGWTAADALGQGFSAVTEPQKEAFKVAQQTLAGTGDWSGELTHALKDHRQVVVATRWTYVRDEHGLPRSILSIGTDITERRKLEAQYLRAQRMDTIGTLAGGIAHDLNNMLTPVVLSAEVLRTTPLDTDQLELVETIQTAAQRGADMVAQVLLFARGETGRRQLLRPSELLAQTVRIAANSMPKNIELRVEADAELPSISGDPTQLEQVLMNLSVNARDAMPEGGTLTFSAHAVVLDREYVAANPAARPGRHVVLGVTDTGTGISPEVKDRIFDPFFTTKEVGKGSGLGLATSLGIATAHGGFINVYSEVGKGTTIKVFLPAQVDASEVSREAVARATLPRGQGQLVLVVDDEPTIRSVTRRTLESLGYRTLEAGNGAEALAVFAQAMGKIELAIIDMSMPVLDGVSTIRALHHLDPQNRLKVIAASGLGVNGAFARASAAGVKHFLEKPFTAGALLEMVHEALSS